MARHGHEVTFADAGDRNHPPVVTLDMLRGYDVVVAQRWNKHDGLGTWRRASLWAKLVYDLDDDLWHITAENWNAYQHYNQPEIRDATTHAAETASLVTVSTEPLAATVREEAGHDRVIVLPNCIPEWVTLLPRPRRDRPRVGWQGGASHGIDIGQVAAPVRRFLRRFPNWDLQLNGADYRHTFRAPADRAFFTGWVPIQEEPDKYYASVDFDIGLAPLWPTRFSAAKSNVKIVEYGARGIPSVASDCPAYRDTITHGVDGFLVKHDHEWLKYLSVLASDDALREKMGAAAVEMARRHLIEDGWTAWRDAYEIMFRLHWPHCLLSGSQVMSRRTCLRDSGQRDATGVPSCPGTDNGRRFPVRPVPVIFSPEVIPAHLSGTCSAGLSGSGETMSLTHDELALGPDAYSSGGHACCPAPVTRVYLRGGHVAHYLEAVAVNSCGGESPFSPFLRDDWLGTGSQHEYDVAARLPLCPKCFAWAHHGFDDERLGTAHGAVMT